MLQNYLLIHKSVLPECFLQVMEAKQLLEDGKAKDVTDAVKKTGISRSTFYKYRDFVLEPASFSETHKAVLAMMLRDEPGMLSQLLRRTYEAGGSVLTITQSLPIRGKASVTMAIDVSNISRSIKGLLDLINETDGVENARLLAIE